MFEVSDIVAYGTNGVCTVTEITTKRIDKVNELLENIPKENEEWISNKNIRFETFKNIIAEGKSSELLKLIRTLRLHEKQQFKRGKRLHMADERFLKEAEKMVLGEFAYVLNETTDDILNRIVNCA